MRASVLQLVQPSRSVPSALLVGILHNLAELERRDPALLLRYAEEIAYDLRMTVVPPTLAAAARRPR